MGACFRKIGAKHPGPRALRLGGRDGVPAVGDALGVTGKDRRAAVIACGEAQARGASVWARARARAQARARARALSPTRTRTRTLSQALSLTLTLTQAPSLTTAPAACVYLSTLKSVALT
jgi:hypothetical protein